ncbi:TetR/AcrR family transcriptional regulator [Corallococcus sp. M34]|uniref:TetR/AcrR family transcriptional regulator C-terminal domain-containing protein n=1 Tax=Citreicoccus inhibens TaxID=2849499 RepID=UPI001C23A9A2|nr:TetR/AcrR family transcriptional regulator C-terminal domain-containing protein [Citreicoccus inhibens]MBU8895427.1 TetR/AcrR family transcriptional regulator [Citreicoccus inhibens]
MQGRSKKRARKQEATQSIWTREEPGARQPKLSRAKIAEAAIAIADTEGFDAVSMRSVAQRLGGSTMSLYYYVKTRAELLALMDDALMGELLLPTVSKKGPQALLDIALGTAEMLRRHPWALVAMRGAPPGPNALRHAEQCLETLAETKLSAKEKLTLLAMVDDYVFGHALREAETQTPTDEALAKKLLATGDFPRLEETFRHGKPTPDPKRLRRGLEALIRLSLPI